MAEYVRVTAPVANLRRRPTEASPLNVHDEDQESQVLFHEALLVREETTDWLRVEAVEQQKSGPHGWQGYPGWVRKKDVTQAAGPGEGDGVVKRPFSMVRATPSAAGQAVFPLSLGTRPSLAGEAKGFFEVAMEGRHIGWVPKRDISLSAGDSTGDERVLVKTARLFLGAAYLWGGRSMPMPWSRGPLMGVDCSGLVNLVFRVLHIDLPRDAHDQWLTATAVAPQALRPGDLIFLSRQGDAGSVDHVIFSLGGEQFIEAAETGGIVRIRTFSQRFGLSLRALGESGLTVHGRRISFGRIG